MHGAFDYCGNGLPQRRRRLWECGYRQYGRPSAGQLQASARFPGGQREDLESNHADAAIGRVSPDVRRIEGILCP